MKSKTIIHSIRTEYQLNIKNLNIDFHRDIKLIYKMGSLPFSTLMFFEFTINNNRKFIIFKLDVISNYCKDVLLPFLKDMYQQALKCCQICMSISSLDLIIN